MRESGRGEPCGVPPPTPPCVRFRTRRFMRRGLGVEAPSGASLPPVERVTVLPWRSMQPMRASAASGRGSRHGYGGVGPVSCKLVQPSKDRSPSGTSCSALRRSVRLLRLLLTPAAPSRRLSAAVAHLFPGAGRQASQGKTRDLRAIYLSHLRPHPPGDIGLRVHAPPRPDADASYALAVRQAGTLLTASVRPRLAATPLLFG